MAGSSAVDGGRDLKAGVLAFGALIWAAPVIAQPRDPLAPLPDPASTQPAATQDNQPGIANTPTYPPPPVAFRLHGPAQQPVSAVGLVPTSPPAIVQPAPASTVAAPKDWRGVFDAIDNGDWAAARAGIAALPPGVLTPVATAELYTAKSSPTVDLASLQTLIDQAPELPEAQQLALMAWKRGAPTMPAYFQERQTVNLGS